MQAQVRQNFHPDSEAAINKLISIKYYTSYVYLAMSFYFERDDVALESFAKYFHELSELLRKNAEELINYQKLRGGRVQLENIEKPERREWTNGLDAIQFALELQKTINKCLLELHHLASNKHDPQTCCLSHSSIQHRIPTVWKQVIWPIRSKLTF
ncbi:ferritin heavy chain B-like isoform X2 [Rhincodon typus]|uniref:ferritin heavy chain B-like isoform X2 n=1 Tax=Rhincodon typus TaxID=259920 RepID=UPI00202DE234|nr:ferritin heavy chain B-like isoform X2 [Rhincodon typus]